MESVKKIIIIVITIGVTSTATSYGIISKREGEKYVLDSLFKYTPIKWPKIKPEGKPYVINIRTQREFDNINNFITDAVVREKNIIVLLAPGIYFFNEHHIIRKNETSDASITIKGNNSIIVAAGYDYHNNDDYKGKYEIRTTYVDLNTLEAYDLWEDTRVADSLVEIIDDKRGLCRLPVKSNEIRALSRHAVIRLTQWYKTRNYCIVSYDKKGIIFNAEDLEYVDIFKFKGYNVNLDYIYGGRLPRFKLYNPANLKKDFRIDKGKVTLRNKAVHECIASNFLNIKDCNYKTLSLKDLTFVGNSGTSQLLYFDNVKTESISISNCHFKSIQSTVLTFKSTSNVEICNNTLDSCYYYGFRIYNGCKNVEVLNNNILNCGLLLSNSHCITCAADNYHIANNKFCNFEYCAIGLGVWYGSNKKYPSRGIVEKNEFWQAKDYFLNRKDHTIMDAGAIYLWTQNDDAIIRYNYIHDYAGMKDYRGIFCDDGASNFKIVGNIILNIPNGYSISSRYVKDDINENYSNNSNNIISYNIIDNGIRFEGYKTEDRNCIKGVNLLLENKDSFILKSRYDYLSICNDDISICRNKRRIVSAVKKWPCYSEIKKIIYNIFKE